MKHIIVVSVLFVFGLTAFSQGPIDITVPAFADPKVKAFYITYTDHLKSCVEAIRQKDEPKVMGLFKDPGEKLVSQEKILAVQLFKDPVEKDKYLQLAEQVHPYLKEVERSEYYQKRYGKK